MMSSKFFVVGGTLEPTEPSYVEREADKELEALIQAGKFGYVLTARQLGKSSLITRTADRLKKKEVRTAIIDLTRIGKVAGGDDNHRRAFSSPGERTRQSPAGTG